MEGQLSPKEVARICGVSADTIRHYEKRGVIPESVRSANGYRRFPAGIVERVRIVRNALRIGFTIDELAALLRQRRSGRPPCREARALAASRLRDVEQQIEELQTLRDDIRELLSDWDDRLAVTTGGEPAHLLDSLTKGNSIDAHSDVVSSSARSFRPRR